MKSTAWDVSGMKLIGLAVVFVLAGCAAGGPLAGVDGSPLDQCRVDVARLQGQLAAEVAERQRLARAGSRREEVLKRQLEAMKSIERGILEREDRMRTETR